jgi:hypothetical protein
VPEPHHHRSVKQHHQKHPHHQHHHHEGSGNDRKFVDHTYRDHWRDPHVDASPSSTTSAALAAAAAARTRGDDRAADRGTGRRGSAAATPKERRHSTSASSSVRKGPRGGVTVTFPENLHNMLSACAAEGLDDVVAWQPHGRCFLVRKKKEFVEKIMPRCVPQQTNSSWGNK